MSQPATTIAPHTFIKGELHLDGPAVIAGRVQGNIAAADTLEIAPEGIIDGDIHGTVVTIHGTVKGNIIACQTCRLGPTARVAGELCTANLAIAEGARFIGQVCVGTTDAPTDAETPAAAETVASRSPPSPEPPVVRTVEAAITRFEKAAHVEEPPRPIPTTMTMPLAPEMPSVQALSQNLQATLLRTPRIIKAR